MNEKDDFNKEDNEIKENYDEDYDPDEEPISNADDFPGESESDVDDIINGDNDPDEELEDDSKSNKRFFVLLGIIIGILVIIFAGFYFLKDIAGITGAVTLDDLHRKNIEKGGFDENYIYNGFSFVYFDGLWYTQVYRKQDNALLDIPLHFGPRDLQDVNVNGQISEAFKKKEVYITFDPTEKPLTYVALSAAELSLNLVKGIGVMPIAACLVNKTEACESRPIITCKDRDKAIIYLKQDNETGVELYRNCVTISGQGENLVKATDRFLYQWYMVMK